MTQIVIKIGLSLARQAGNFTAAADLASRPVTRVFCTGEIVREHRSIDDYA